MAESLLDLLECHICFQIFNDVDRKPKVLPCQHTFCLSCLNKLAVTTKKKGISVAIKCPECNKKYTAPDGDVANFTNDLTMIKFLDALPQTSTETNDVTEVKKCLSDRLLCVQTKLSDVAEIRAKDISSWEKEVSDARENINEIFAEIQSALDTKKAALLRQLNEFCPTRDALIHKSMTHAFESYIQEIVKFCSIAEEMISKSSSQVSESSILENLNRCQEFIKQLDEALANNESDKKWKVKFQASEKGSIKASIENFGHLELESPLPMIRDTVSSLQPQRKEPDPSNLSNSPGGTAYQTHPQVTMTPFIPSSYHSAPPHMMQTRVRMPSQSNLEGEESTPAAPTAAEEKKEVKTEVVTPAVDEHQQQEIPETTTAITKKESKTERKQIENKPELEAKVVEKSGQLSEKEVPKVDKDNDQWNPVNLEGKKQYGRDFLLQFQIKCKAKPDGLPHIPNIVMDKADIRPIAGVADPMMAQTRGGGAGGGGGGRGGIDFIPDYMRSSLRGSGAPQQFPQGDGGRRSSREPKKVIARASTGPEASLKEAENAWKPGSKKDDPKKPLNEEEAKLEELTKSFKSILNKLTPQNFQKLLAKTLELPIDNEERLTAIIDLVFEKAITESAFSKAYANMCRVLSQIKVPAAKGEGNVQFRTILINRCQKAVESEKAENDDLIKMKKEIEAMEDGKAKKKEGEELVILQSKAKLKVLGNMRFFGELYKVRMLTENIMHDCIFKLLRAKDEDSLECMSQLMTTVGKDLDHKRAKNRMDQYFTQISKIVSKKKTSARIRFMLQDVEDLRKCHWIPRQARR